MPRCPEFIKIGLHAYETVRLSNREMVAKGWGDENAHIDPDNLKIFIRKPAHASKVKEWLFHELFHSCHDFKGVYDQRFRSDEEWIDATCLPLLQILRDNPDLVAYLTE